MIRYCDDDISDFRAESGIRGGFYAVENRSEDLGDEGAELREYVWAIEEMDDSCWVSSWGRGGGGSTYVFGGVDASGGAMMN